MNACYLCGGKSFMKRPGKVRDKLDLDILECESCGLVFLSSFDHIGSGFYENSQMDGKDSSIQNWARETVNDDQRRFKTLQPLITNKTILDFGCGNGGFLEKAGQVTAKAVGMELEERLKLYFISKKLEVYSNLEEILDFFDIITLFHVLEHLPDPLKVLQQLKANLNPGGCIIVETPNAEDALLTLYKNSPFAYFTYWSCHLFLFNSVSLAKLAKKAGLKINSIQQIQRYPLSTHLYWLANGKSGGHARWNFLNSQELADAYEKQLGLMGRCDTLLAYLGVDND